MNADLPREPYRVRRAIALNLAVVLAAALISACGQQSPNPTQQQQAAADAADEARARALRAEEEALRAEEEALRAEEGRRAAAEKAAAEKAAADKAAAERLAAAKADAEGHAKAGADKAAAEKAAAERQAAAKAEQERLAAAKAEEERSALTATAEAEARPKAAEAPTAAPPAPVTAEREAKANADADRLKQIHSQLPEFPWPPPRASASYVLPDSLFRQHQSVGAVVGAIIGALEPNGYVERSFFRTGADGVAIVTRLERFNQDGSSLAAPQRWPSLTATPYDASPTTLLLFLRGLFVVDPGRYRIIVFILQDLPFSQSLERIPVKQAQGWLSSGANILSPEAANRSFSGSHCTVLVYEFASDGSQVSVVESRLTGKDHLAKAGVLTFLEKPN